jgi:hypothetical protein
MPSETYTLFRNSILAGQQVICSYAGRHRELYPLILGTNKDGDETVLAWQFGGESFGKLPQWRCLKLANVSDAHAGVQHTHDGYLRRCEQSCIFNIDIDSNIHVRGAFRASETLLRVQALVADGEYLVSRHGFRELMADDILIEDVLASIQAAVVVEDYPASRKEPSVLVLQCDCTGQPVHVVWGLPRTECTPVLVTAYRPKPELWSADFLNRKKP